MATHSARRALFGLTRIPKDEYHNSKRYEELRKEWNQRLKECGVRVADIQAVPVGQMPTYIEGVSWDMSQLKINSEKTDIPLNVYRRVTSTNILHVEFDYWYLGRENAGIPLFSASPELREIEIEGLTVPNLSAPTVALRDDRARVMPAIDSRGFAVWCLFGIWER